MLLQRKSCLQLLSAEYIHYLQNLLLVVRAKVAVWRTGDGDQALANKVLFNTATTYQVIASSLWFKAKKVVYISSTNTHTQKKRLVLYLSVEQWMPTAFAICMLIGSISVYCQTACVYWEALSNSHLPCVIPMVELFMLFPSICVWAFLFLVFSFYLFLLFCLFLPCCDCFFSVGAYQIVYCSFILF